MEERTKSKLKLAGIAITGIAVAGTAMYLGHKELCQRAYEDGLKAGAILGKDMMVGILERCDPESGLISYLRDLGIKVSRL